MHKGASADGDKVARAHSDFASHLRVLVTMGIGAYCCCSDFSRKARNLCEIPNFSVSDLVQIVLSTMWVQEKASEDWIQLETTDLSETHFCFLIVIITGNKPAQRMPWVQRA